MHAEHKLARRTQSIPVETPINNRLLALLQSATLKHHTVTYGSALAPNLAMCDKSSPINAINPQDASTSQNTIVGTIPHQVIIALIVLCYHDQYDPIVHMDPIVQECSYGSNMIQ